jgi:hypothetical protein
MTDLEFLLAVRGVLDSPEKWTQGRLAKAADGIAVKKVDSPDAACWCIVGAGTKVTTRDSGQHPADWLGRLLEIPTFYPAIEPFESHYRQVVLFNDSITTTYDMVADILDKAIAREIAKLNSAPATPSA